MTKAHSNWKTLPVEILHEIFQLIPAKESYNFSLVCKAWLQPARWVLYSVVNIESMLQLKAFKDTMEHSSHFGSKTKSLTLDYMLLYTTHDNNWAEVETFDFLTTVLSNHLPNLEVLIDFALYSYVPTLEALMKHRLKHLKRLNPPFSLNYKKTEIANYVTCALLMKDRLENIFISDKDCFVDTRAISDRLFFNRLFNQLDQFEKLEEITLEKAVNEEIEVVEHVLHTCKSLKEITFYFRGESETVLLQNNRDISIETISSFATRPNIKALTTEIFVMEDYKMLLYIMHTFTRLQQLSLVVNGCVLDQQMFTKLIHYISEIDDFDVTFSKVYAQTITDNIKNYWEATSKPGSEYVKYVYTGDNDLGEVCSGLHISKSEGSKHTETTIRYPQPNHGWAHKNFTARNGNFLRGMRLAFESSNQISEGMRMLPENFIAHTFKYCPNLQELNLKNCVLKGYIQHSSIDFSKEIWLDVLSLNDCTIYPGVLDQLSLFLRGIKQLRIDNLIHRPIVVQESRYVVRPPSVTILEINMPLTKIDLIVFGKCYLDKNLFIKVLTTSNREYHYYRYETSLIERVEISSELEFNLERDTSRIYICCETLPLFQIDRSAQW